MGSLSVVHEDLSLSLKSRLYDDLRLAPENGKLVCWGDTSYQVFMGLEDISQRTPFELGLGGYGHGL